jgi:hypothetical protein
LHAYPHDVLLQVAEEFGCAGHATQEDPQLFTPVLLTQAPLHTWKPTLQLIPQTAAVQVALPFAGTEHPVLQAPQ